MSRWSDKWKNCPVRKFFRTETGSGCAVVLLAYAILGTGLVFLLRGCGGD